MKIKTLELTGTALDWVVAKCEDLHTGYPGYWSNSVLEAADRGTENPFAYSTKWTLAGPIIERETIAISYDADWVYDPAKVDPEDEPDNGDRWYAEIRRSSHDFISDYGPTPLIAAMRCLVSSKLGDEVDVPEELCQQPNN